MRGKGGGLLIQGKRSMIRDWGVNDEGLGRKAAVKQRNPNTQAQALYAETPARTRTQHSLRKASLVAFKPAMTG